jgi:hypothetical protein
MQPHNTTYELVSIKRDACHTTKIWRRIAPESETEEPYIPDHYLENRRAELDDLESQIQTMTDNPPYRPKWAVGLTNQEVIAVARHEGVNPYKYDWWDALDPVVIKEARQQAFKRPGLESITDLKHRRANLRREIAWLETQPTNTKLSAG